MLYIAKMPYGMLALARIHFTVEKRVIGYTIWMQTSGLKMENLNVIQSPSIPQSSDEGIDSVGNDDGKEYIC